MTDNTFHDLYSAALAAYSANSHAKAAALCRELLMVAPEHADANHLLGSIELDTGNPAAAEQLFRTALLARSEATLYSDLGLAIMAQKRYPEAEYLFRHALEINPEVVVARSNLAFLLFETGRVPDAESELRTVLTLAPDLVNARFNLTRLLAETNRHESALEEGRRLVELQPDRAEVHDLLGTVLARRSYMEAEAAFRRALKLRPDFVGALCNLGWVLIELGRPEEAEFVLCRALTLDPGFWRAHHELGRLYVMMGRGSEGIESLRKVIELGHESAGVRVNLGALFAKCGWMAEAELEYRRAIELQPDLAWAYSNLGGLLFDTNRLAEAESVLTQALKLDPDSIAALSNQALVLQKCRRFDHAEAMVRRAIDVGPVNARTLANLGNILLAKNSGDIDEALCAFRRAVEVDPDNVAVHSNLVYALGFKYDDGYELLDEGQRFSQRFETPYLAHEVQYLNDPSPDRRLRVGYVSPDFCNHCQSMFTVPLLKNHDHSAFEIYCYSSVREKVEVTHLLAAHADVWRDVADLNDEQLAKIIMDDQIDILVDLTMHMAGGRPLLFARRPAPVQVAWLAYPGTTGSRAIGYRLTDAWLDPIDVPDADRRYAERSVRLPDTFWCYDPLSVEAAGNSLPADEAGVITFGCLNSPSKLTDDAFALWAKILVAVRGARMILLVANGEARERVCAKFENHGVHRSRLQFVDFQLRPDYLRTYRRIDIALDTLPCNGHTTSLDAFWMGVPVVTRVGRTPISRAGYALLANLGLSDLAAQSDEQFVDIAVQLARDRLRLRTLRSDLRQQMERSPLMNGERFARGIEAAFRQIWTDWGAAA